MKMVAKTSIIFREIKSGWRDGEGILGKSKWKIHVAYLLIARLTRINSLSNRIHTPPITALSLSETLTPSKPSDYCLIKDLEDITGSWGMLIAGIDSSICTDFGPKL